MNKKEIYEMMPDVLKAHHIKRGKAKGMTGEEHFLNNEALKEKDIVSLFTDKTDKQIDSHLTQLCIAVEHIAEYFKIIESPFKNEAEELKHSMFNFSLNFYISDEEDREMGIAPEEDVSFHTSNLKEKANE